MAFGINSSATGNHSVALGSGAQAAVNNAVALGRGTVADRTSTVAVGGRQVVDVAAGTQGTDAVNYAQLKAAGLTTDTSGNATNSFVAYDDTTKVTVTLGGGATGTKLANVAAGTLSESSKDAVNGSQLYATNQKVAQNADAITQNAIDISTNAGNIAQNTTDIGTLNTQVGAINDEMTDVVKYDTSAHDTLKLAGTAGTTITNMAAGELSASSTEAVNGSQLYATNQKVAQNADAIAQHTTDISTNASNIAQNTTDISTLNTQISTINSAMSNVVSRVRGRA